MIQAESLEKRFGELWAVDSFEGAIWRDFTLAEKVLPCVVLVAVGLVTFGLGVFFVSRSKA